VWSIQFGDRIAKLPLKARVNRCIEAGIGVTKRRRRPSRRLWSDRRRPSRLRRCGSPQPDRQRLQPPPLPEHLLRAEVNLFSDERLPAAELARRSRVSRRPSDLGGNASPRYASTASLKTRPVDLPRAARRSHPLDGKGDAKRGGFSLISSPRIWASHGLQPHRLRTFKSSDDPPPPPRPKKSSASTSVRPPARSSSRSTRNRKFGRSTARSRACHFRAGSPQRRPPCRSCATDQLAPPRGPYSFRLTTS